MRVEEVVMILVNMRLMVWVESDSGVGGSRGIVPPLNINTSFTAASTCKRKEINMNAWK